MKKPTSLMTFGALTALTPFAGIPGSWKSVLLVAIGLGVVLIGFLLRRHAVEGRQHDTFVESNNGVTQ